MKKRKQVDLTDEQVLYSCGFELRDGGRDILLKVQRVLSLSIKGWYKNLHSSLNDLEVGTPNMRTTPVSLPGKIVEMMRLPEPLAA